MNDPIQFMYDEGNCHIPSHNDDTEVMVEAGIYHDPDNLPSTLGMKSMSVSKAYHEHGYTACSKCFNDQQTGIYPNSYLREEIPLQKLAVQVETTISQP